MLVNREFIDRVLHIEQLVHQWVTLENEPITEINRAYVSLMFAFALARFQQENLVQEHLQQVSQVLSAKRDPYVEINDPVTKKNLYIPKRNPNGVVDPVHKYLLGAFQYRIEQAFARKPHSGPLSQQLLKAFSFLERLPQYQVNRLRAESEILDPDEQIDPYLNWKTRSGGLEKQLAELHEQTDANQFQIEMDNFFSRITTGKDKPEVLLQLLQEVLSLAPRIGSELTIKVLNLVPRFLQMETVSTEREWFLLEHAIFKSAFLKQGDLLRTFLHLLIDFDKKVRNTHLFSVHCRVIGECLQPLRQFGMKEEMQQLVASVDEGIAQGRITDPFRPKNSQEWLETLVDFLPIAGGWHYLGNQDRAIPLFNQARTILFDRESLARHKQYPDYTKLTRAYIHALTYLPMSEMLARLEELFAGLAELPNTFTTASHYSRFHLNIIEETVWSLIRATELDEGSDMPIYQPV